MFRSLTIIIAALLLARPGMSRDEAASYATVLQQEAKEHRFDPFTGVALIRRESHWQPRSVSQDGEDYGLAQIRARYVGACRSDPDPVHAPSEACQHVKNSLLNGAYNIRVMATLITRNRELCKDKTGSALFGQWLASYEGRNFPGRDKWCQPAEGTQEVIRYQQWLVSKLTAPRKRTATADRASNEKRKRSEKGIKRDKGDHPASPKPTAPKRDTKRAPGAKHRR